MFVTAKLEWGRGGRGKPQQASGNIKTKPRESYKLPHEISHS